LPDVLLREGGTARPYESKKLFVDAPVVHLSFPALIASVM